MKPRRVREMQIKKWRREKKVWLIQRENPFWEDRTPKVLELLRLD